MIRGRPERGEDQEVLRGESDDSPLQPLFKMTQHAMMRKLKKTSGLLQENSFIVITLKPRVKLYIPKEESFPFPLKYIDVTRTTKNSLDILLEKKLMITGMWVEKENYQMHGQVSQGHMTDLHGLE